VGVAEFRSLKRKPLPRPAMMTRMYGALGLSAPSEFTPVRYRLERRRRYALIYLHQGNQMWSLNDAIGRNPKTYAEARKLVQQIAATHGYPPLEEITKDRKKVAPLEDRRLLKAGVCKESWLSSDYPELWAEAMMRCQHPGGHCGQDGYCHMGDCDMETK